MHILNKSIFDAMNESLTKFRPYGIIGEPLPWSKKYRRLQTEVDINSVDTERLFQMVK
jgi:long-subunit acyl-CoA synthetase (AMP-forming)